MSFNPLKATEGIGDNAMRESRPMGRRTLLKAAAALGAAGLLGVSEVRGQAESNPSAQPANVKLAEELKLTFVPLHTTFQEAAKAAPTAFWLWDGIHPTPSGHALLVPARRRVVGF